MPSNLFDHLKDMHAHMAWADSVWFDTWGGSGFQGDVDLRQRVQHMALTQAAFLMVLRNAPITFDSGAPLPRFEDLRDRTRDNHDAFKAFFLDTIPEELGRDLVIPWFPGAPCHVTMDEALTQVALPSTTGASS